MTVVLDGTKHIAIGDGERHLDLRVPAGEVLFMAPQAWTQPRFDSPRTILALVFQRRYTRLVLSRHPGDGSPVIPDWYLHLPATLGAAGAHLLQALGARSQGVGSASADLADTGMVQALCALVHQLLLTTEDHERRGAEATYESIRQHLLDVFGPDQSRAAVARRFGLHPHYVSMLFRAHAGETFQACLTRVRMERAATLLQRPGSSIAATAAACGYADASAFIRAFRRHHGRTPKQYRRR